MSENKKHFSCQCQVCLEQKATWMIIYGVSPQMDFCFTCALCIGKMIDYLTNESKRAKPFTTFYAERFDSKGSYNPEWNENWKKHFNTCL